ncbi:AraC family transcriptional regulator [Alteromonas sp. KUL17]|uniref:helix-turn-helix domain-containing protein n=1 Tax=Alteromonas sp. KUL17 TaxID=2480796 RepID=UPI001037EA59|nr:helix-turn-helix domain-containing protein [Alteromonas sp. KUL17]TAP30572.1 AraC family transcriptional regulator [Alteromonas sp. KUL17]GEA01562.1 AraC family transcriptional regulator [Alteromonas sp. KUL17]
MAGNTKFYEHIGDYLSAIGVDAPAHPLVASLKLKEKEIAERSSNVEPGTMLSGGFYFLSLKQIVEGQVHYGQTHYDCQTGTLYAIAPEQRVATFDIKTRGDVRILLLHPDYIRGHAIESLLRECGFFHYQINEALHLSISEKQTLANLFDALTVELSQPYEPSSRDIILSNITTLLHYCLRFYRRQFLQRREIFSDWYGRLIKELDRYYAREACHQLPELQEISDALNVSSRYLSDALKAQMGLSAKACMQQYIIDKSKSMLLANMQSVNQIAYALGFDSPNYFSRLFKSKVGVSPNQYRKQRAEKH